MKTALKKSSALLVLTLAFALALVADSSVLAKDGVEDGGVSNKNSTSKSKNTGADDNKPGDGAHQARGTGDDDASKNRAGVDDNLPKNSGLDDGLKVDDASAREAEARSAAEAAVTEAAAVAADAQEEADKAAGTHVDAVVVEEVGFFEKVVLSVKSFFARMF